MAFLWSLSVPVLWPVDVAPLPADVPLFLGPFVLLCCCLQKMLPNSTIQGFCAVSMAGKLW